MGTFKVCEDNGMTPPMKEVEMMGRNMPFNGSTSAPTPMDGAANRVTTCGELGFASPIAPDGTHVQQPKTTPPPEAFFG